MTYLCTLEEGHDGPHEHWAAEGANQIRVATWTDPIGIPAVVAAHEGRQLPHKETIPIIEEDWARLMGLLQTVEETAAEHETCKKAAADAKKDHEAAQAALQRALTRMRDGLHPTNEPTLPFESGPAAELPHGGVHQSDVVQAAHDDPAVVTLTNRLLAIRWDVTPELVAGWTVDERAQLVAWLDGLGVMPALADGQPGPQPVPELEYYERDNGIDGAHWRFVADQGEGDDSLREAEWQFRNEAAEEWQRDPSQEQIGRWWRNGQMVAIHQTAADDVAATTAPEQPDASVPPIVDDAAFDQAHGLPEEG